jgi:hypothetical protein
MSKLQIFLLVTCMSIGLGGLFLLFHLSPLNKEVQRFSFNRRFAPQKTLAEIGRVALKVNSFYFSGATSKRIYLGNWTNPFHLLEVELHNLDTTHFDVRLETDQIPSDYEVFRMRVDSPYFYLTHGRLPDVLEGTLQQRIAKRTFNQMPPFAEARPISPGRVVLRCYSQLSKAYELAMLSIDTPRFELKPELLQKQVDGIFCEEGILHFDKTQKRLTYLYAYRNEFFTMDSTLRLVGRYHTIDTFSRAHIKVAYIASENLSTLASPPVRTNGLSTVFENRLFVQSVLLSKNEEMVKFMTSTVIDVYNLSNGDYIHSFYLPHLDGASPSDILVTKDYFAAIYERKLILYQLPTIN